MHENIVFLLFDEVLFVCLVSHCYYNIYIYIEINRLSTTVYLIKVIALSSTLQNVNFKSQFHQIPDWLLSNTEEIVSMLYFLFYKTILLGTVLE